VVGTRDPATEFYQERYREWHFMTSATAVAVLDEAGHFFLKYRARELAEILTTTHQALASDATEPLRREARGAGATWWLHGASRSEAAVAPPGVQPSFKRFFPIAASQLVSAVGSAMTEFAVPLWIYTTTGSVAKFALMAVAGLVPGLLALPVAGALTDRLSRRKVMLAGDTAAFTVQLVFGILLWTGHLGVTGIYPLLACLSVALTFQRIAYFSAVPQLVPKHSLGHAVGLMQMGTGTAQLLVPIFAVGLLAGIGLGGIVGLDIASYAVAIVTLLLVRFPATMAWRRKESFLAEMLGGLRYSLGSRGFVGMLGFFIVMNIFLAPLMLMFGPLVLTFARLADVGRISVLAGAGVIAGGLAMMTWGGPRHHRMRGVLLCTVALGCFCMIAGLRSSLPVIAVGVCGMTAWLTLLNGIYTTIVQVKVPQRFHGRVFAIQTLIAWSTLPVGYGLVAPNVVGQLSPLMAKGGALASTAGALIGTGPGRGIGLMYVLFGLALVAVALIAMRVPVLARFDRDVPDAIADDLVGLQALSAAGAPAKSPSPSSPSSAKTEALT
jgi:MFS family permease